MLTLQCPSPNKIYLQEKYGNEKNFVEKIKLVGLRNRESFQGAVSRFDLLNHMEVGNFVFHKSAWGVGHILDVSLLREQLVVDLQLKMKSLIWQLQMIPARTLRLRK